MNDAGKEASNLGGRGTVSENVDILLWAGLAPIKLGSFEEFLIKLCVHSESRGLRIKCVLLEPSSSQVLEVFDRNSVDYELLPYSQHSSPFALIHYLRKYKPRSFYLHFYGAGSSLIPCAYLFSAAKVIFHDHNSLEDAYSNKETTNRPLLENLRDLKRNRYSSLIERYLVVSEFKRRSYKVNSSRFSRKINVVHNGVNLDRFSPPADEQEKARLRLDIFNKQDHSPIITFVGSVDENKGIDVFLAVATNYASRRIPACFAIVGDGDRKDLVERFVEESAFDNLIYLGLRSDVDKVLKASDVFIAPYRWGEAFGLTLIEAGACGLPIIATDVGAIPEVLGEGDGAVCVPSGETSSIIKELDKLIDNPQRRIDQGTLARNRVERLFDIRKTVENTVSFLER